MAPADVPHEVRKADVRHFVTQMAPADANGNPVQMALRRISSLREEGHVSRSSRQMGDASPIGRQMGRVVEVNRSSRLAVVTSD
jgi:hypothetical protein